MTNKKNLLQNHHDSEPQTHKERIQALKQYLAQLKINVKKFDYYLHALTHRSYTNEINETYSYERLEYLGDAVLDLIVCEALFNMSNELTEGEMSTIQRMLVQQNTMVRAAKEIGLDKYIFIGKSLRHNIPDKVICDCFEAFVAAIYLDQGNKNYIKKLVNNTLLRYYWTHDLEESTDYKSILQELLQTQTSRKIDYKFKHDKKNNEYNVVVMVDEVIYGRGTAKTIRAAEKIAAKNALNKYKQN
ncbi:ribonuclease-3 [Mycoplasmoides fastidiosum]|uniref:Ribonuclease 3 n=1 Tax=Mycoplasmoides fastidiosum TaxID=92758 RepID=A0ABU0LZD8_9BACT|nr:ribonuclease III [Mycoplasmoides fastidiosum]MDQ0514053.1 ribonuclease-3 [Mycoplasmoides fastidiosum]UUD37536.1 ribonuclease III [Mycoplasmoides fastidiosum]